MTTSEWLRDAVRRITRGSDRLVWLIARRIARRLSTCWRAITKWLGEASGMAWLLRLGLLILLVVIVRNIGMSIGRGLLRRADAARWLLWPLLIAWLIAAYRTGREDWEPKAEPQQPVDEPAETEQPAAPVGELPRLPPLPSLEDLRLAVTEVGTPHAHITALATVLDTTPDRVREALAAWAIPVEPVRMRGRGSSTGVKGDPFPAPLPPAETPSRSVVAAGQPANNDNNGPIVDRRDWGITMTDRAARQHRPRR
ncbi:hypothetical protein [Streptomyces sp. AcH 505]|uniref:hypothetical protein n=1 Tax=Streptomyces sp. AcH 505 TaxID=352211 RepID=UPI0005A71999